MCLLLFIHETLWYEASKLMYQLILGGSSKETHYPFSGWQFSLSHLGHQDNVESFPLHPWQSAILFRRVEKWTPYRYEAMEVINSWKFSGSCWFLANLFLVFILSLWKIVGFSPVFRWFSEYEHFLRSYNCTYAGFKVDLLRNFLCTTYMVSYLFSQ